jgi:carboxyl-terminal processing protease
MKRLGLIAATAGAVFLLALHQDVGAAPTSTENTPDTYKQLTLFGDVFDLVRADYVDPVSDDTLVEGAINGMLTALELSQRKKFQ